MLHPINWSLALPYYAAAFCFGYLLGSIPFGLVLTRLAGTQDLRTIGSGNIGATNVLRTGKKGLAALGAFLGHLFPIWLKFNGGKGVATYIGLIIAFVWQAALAFGVVWLIVAVVTRNSSLAGLVASVASVLFLWWDGYLQEAQLFGLLTVLIWAKHHHNIARLVAGTESKIGR